jgi:hypothetical protein
MYGVGRAGGFERSSPRICTHCRTKGGMCWCDEFVDFKWTVPPELLRQSRQ